QSLRMQEYRYGVLSLISRFFGLFGLHKPVRYARPVEAGTYDTALHTDHPDAPSFLDQYLDQPEPHLGGAPNVTAKPDETEKL
ncbi:MAG TPA: hypothetical protein VFF70_07640, partial [Anaerolineae bacterium]|nr:hypothetical protein [Anaerolineae bacterium]